MSFGLPPAAIGGFLTSFAAVVIAGPSMIEGLKRLRIRQPIGLDAPQPEAHKLKQGTPTMGGVLFVIGVLAAVLVALAMNWIHIGQDSGKLIAIVVILILHMGIGFVDDYLKVVRGKAMGLTARQKLAAQAVVALGFVIYLATISVPGVTTSVTLSHDIVLNLSPWLYYPLVIILMMGLSNSVNLTDGLDGLAAGLAVPAYIGLAIAGFVGVNSDVLFFGWAMAGGCLGFVVYNGFPARVFMGDTGSLAIGGSLAAFAVLSKQELLVLVFCLVYIIEAVSVIIQVVSFRLRGKRVFRMAPIHHHFEMSGWREVQVVQRFWIAGIILLWLGLLAASWLSPFAQQRVY